MPPIEHSPAPESGLYRRVWRWHFYAGLVCLPFLALMALTGALYLFKEPLESLVYASLRFTPSVSASTLDAEALVAKARAAVPGDAVRFVAPAQAGRSAEVGIRTPEGMQSVYLDPADGRVLGSARDDLMLMEIVKRIHSLVIVGPVANHWVEIVAGWSIVLVASGVFLWWPRGRRGGVYSVRGRPAQRTWWRDLHAVVGITASVAILFLAVTGMPWSAFWGKQFSRFTNEFGIGLPTYVFAGKPESAPPLESLGEVPWALTQSPIPQSAPRERIVRSIGLNAALDAFGKLHIPAGTPVRLPEGPLGVYTATLFPDDVTTQRVVHLDRYSGAVLADVGYPDYGVAGRATSWGVSLHTGRQFGLVNQLVMLAGCLSIVALAVSAVVMWWKRRPRGRLAAPPRKEGDRAAFGAIGVAVLLGLLYPLLGASMLAALLVDAAIPKRWHERLAL